MEDLEIREIDTDSPIAGLAIGNLFKYSGTYLYGYDEGESKIVKIFDEIFYANGVPEDINKIPSWLRLENGKMVLLGFTEKNVFTPSNRFKL